MSRTTLLLKVNYGVHRLDSRKMSPVHRGLPHEQCHPVLATDERAEGGRVRSTMSFGANRELLVQVAPRYRAARRGQRSTILDEFVAVTGYDRKYAIGLLIGPVRPLSRSVTHVQHSTDLKFGRR